MSYTIEKIGPRIRAAREASGETRTALADLCNVSRQFLSRVESGEVVPSLERLVQLCEALGLEPGAVLREA